MLTINGNSVRAETYILHYRNKLNEGLIDLHEYGRHLRKAKNYPINKDFMR